MTIKDWRALFAVTAVCVAMWTLLCCAAVVFAEWVVG